MNKLYGWNCRQHISKKCQAQRRQQLKQIIHQLELYLVTLATKIYYKIYMPSRKYTFGYLRFRDCSKGPKICPPERHSIRSHSKKIL